MLQLIETNQYKFKKNPSLTCGQKVDSINTKNINEYDNI